MRSAVFADAIGRQQRLKYDRELLCVSAVLHELGLTKIAPVEARFELEGADAARRFLLEKGMSERRVEIAWTRSRAIPPPRFLPGNASR
jgi:hypothetical protein